MATLKKSHGTAFLLAAILSFATAGPRSGVVAQQPPATAARVAIILGNAPAGDDEPTVLQTARCLKAFELYKSGAVNTLLVTGGFTQAHISEARMMTIALVTYGVAPADIIEDQLASSTIENAVFGAKLFEQRGWAKSTMLVSQAFHLPRANGIFKERGFEVKDATSADALTAPADFATVLDMKEDVVVNAAPSDLIVVYEPFRSLEAMEWPTTQLAHRLRVAATLYHRKIAPRIVLFNDRYTRGPVNIAQMMKIALVSLGVPAANITVTGRTQYRRLPDLAAALGDTSAIVLTARAPSPGAGAAPGPAMPPAAALPAKWKMVHLD